MTGMALRIVAIELFERAVRYRLPFRFGAATVTEGVQAFVRVRVRTDDGRESDGASSELMVPKWFDKDPALSADDNIDQLRRALRIARDAYLEDGGSRTAFGHFAAHASACISEGARHGLPPLAANFGPAEIDKAVLDALCRALRVSFFAAVDDNVVGFAPGMVAPDLAGLDAHAFLRSLAPRDALAVRHTVGLADALPESLEQAIRRHGLRWFTVKLGGDVDADLARLAEVSAVLDPLAHYGVTLDGNEQFTPPALAALIYALTSDAHLARLAGAVAFVEQPLPRAITFDAEVPRGFPMLIDEADATMDAFPRARARGYTGVSSKSCKGIYKSLVNAMRCAVWGAPYFLSAEDLTTPAGLALEQDLALASILGVEHVERNGYHYLDERTGGVPIDNGAMSTRSLRGVGFASEATPDWTTLSPMRESTSTQLTEQ